MFFPFRTLGFVDTYRPRKDALASLVHLRLSIYLCGKKPTSRNSVWSVFVVFVATTSRQHQEGHVFLLQPNLNPFHSAVDRTLCLRQPPPPFRHTNGQTCLFLFLPGYPVTHVSHCTQEQLPSTSNVNHWSFFDFKAPLEMKLIQRKPRGMIKPICCLSWPYKLTTVHLYSIPFLESKEKITG